ncbi:MAG TPA: glycosyltransferase family 4 protein [Candidatus Nanoarchaeia archaeon]|nr:glycosyltransferase family 4 protein [Candidatus Nanoarchaeia archaeon]
MKIAIIGQKGIPSRSGGIEKHVEDLSVRLVKAGHEVLVYTRPNYTDKNLQEFQGVKLISLPSIATKHLDAITHTFLACFDVAKRDVDVIHFHSIGPSSLLWLVKILKPGVPVIATYHCQDYYHQKWGLFAKIYLKIGEFFACRVADKTIAVSKVLKEFAAKQYGRVPEYIPNGVVEGKNIVARDIKKFGLEKDGYILSVGRLVKHKGFEYLIRAFKNVKTDKKLVIAGGSAFTDKYVCHLKELAAGDKRIVFTGAQTGSVLAELFSNAYLFVQPSESEGLSIALLEAMAYGKATLVSDIPANREAISYTGYTFRNMNVADLVGKLNGLLRNSEMVREMGEMQKKRALKEYDWEKILAKTQNVYRSVATRERLAVKPARAARKLKFAQKFFSLFF